MIENSERNMRAEKMKKKTPVTKLPLDDRGVKMRTRSLDLELTLDDRGVKMRTRS